MTPADIELVAMALREDIGTGDLTTDTFVDSDLRALGRIVARNRLVVSGIEAAVEVFRQVDPALRVEVLRGDGSAVRAGESVMEIRGAARSILTGERVALNFLQHLSGVATLTREFVDAAASTKTKILDTRKTTPGMRRLEKAAVVAGGGVNHRFGLHDMILVKDNHIATGSTRGDMAARIAQLKVQHPKVRVEIEADSLDQVREFLETPGVDIILLDNMKTAQLREAVALRKTRPVMLEASGGITLQTVRQIAATGVDYVSVGALTHSAIAADLSMELTRVAS